jgi:hypothetical protein
VPATGIEYQKQARMKRDHRAQPAGTAAATANAKKSP